MAEQAGGPVAEETEVVETQSVGGTGEATQLVTGFTQQSERPAIDASGTGRPALDLRVSHGDSTGSLRIENPYLAAGLSAGASATGLGALVCLKLDSSQLVEVAKVTAAAAGVASVVVGSLAYLWLTKRGPTKTAIRNSLEGRIGSPVAGARDPEVEGIRRGSLLVEIRCHSRESLVHFIQDYESGEVKLRLEKELSKIGFTEELTVTIENREELDKQINTSSLPANRPSSKQRNPAWRPYQARRLAMEKVNVSKYFGGKVTWINPTDRDNARVESRMTTSNDKHYTLRIYIPADYPNSCPTLAVCSPCSLTKRDGSPMTKETGEDHTYSSRDGLSVISHFKPSSWTGRNFLYEVFIKGLVWLEAYEVHLRTGNPLSAYLKKCCVYLFTSVSAGN